MVPGAAVAASRSAAGVFLWCQEQQLQRLGVLPERSMAPEAASAASRNVAGARHVAQEAAGDRVSSSGMARCGNKCKGCGFSTGNVHWGVAEAGNAARLKHEAACPKHAQKYCTCQKKLVIMDISNY